MSLLTTHSRPGTRTRRKLPWPASTIERDVLHSLWLEAKASGKPITAIVKDAIDAHLTNRIDPQATVPADPSHGDLSQAA